MRKVNGIIHGLEFWGRIDENGLTVHISGKASWALDMALARKMIDKGVIKIMTNSEIYQQRIKSKLESNELPESARDFAEKIIAMDKKQLRGLSSAQFKLMRDLAG